MKNKKTMKTLVSQNLEFLELELSDEELVLVVGGAQTAEDNTLARATLPGGVELTANNPPRGEADLMIPTQENNYQFAQVRPGGQ